MTFHLRFENDIVASDTQVDVTFADEGRNVGGREEDAVLAVSGEIRGSMYGQCTYIAIG